MRFALLALLCLTTVARAEDWPGWLGPRRDGSSSETVAPWKGALTTAWKQDVGEGHSSPVVAGGKVFLHTRGTDKNSERVQAFDAADGKPLWERSYPRKVFSSKFGNGPRATPCVADGKLYTFGVTGILACFDVRDGSPLWQVDTLATYGAANLFFGTSCSPLVDQGRVFINVGGKGASIVAFDKDTGKESWRTGDDKASYASPTLYEQAGQSQLVFLTAANLIALNPRDGKELWKFPFADLIFESSTTPTRIGDILIGSSITRGSVGLKLQGPSQAAQEWLDTSLTCYFATPVAVGKDLYLVAGTKPPSLNTKATLHCVDPQTGKVRWSRDKVGTYHASVLRTGDDKLLLLEESGALVLLQPDPTQYRELARATICGTTWAHAAVAGGKLYIRDRSQLRCIDLSGR